MMNRCIQILLCVLVLSYGVANARTDNDEQRRVFEYYAKAALFELCSRPPVNNRCTEINNKLDKLKPEIYFFKGTSKNEVLIMFSLNDYFPSVTLAYDKDGLLTIVDRGTWLGNKKEFVDAFIESGNFAE